MEILLRVQQCLELLLRHLAAGVPLGSARRAVSGGVVSMMPIMNLYRLTEVTFRSLHRGDTTFVGVPDGQATLLRQGRHHRGGASFVALCDQAFCSGHMSGPLQLLDLFARELLDIIYEWRRVEANIDFRISSEGWGDSGVLAEPRLLEEACDAKSANYGVAGCLELVIGMYSIRRELHAFDLLDVFVHRGLVLSELSRNRQALLVEAVIDARGLKARDPLRNQESLVQECHLLICSCVG